MISKEKREALAKRMESLEIRDEDLSEKFIAGSGKGGQKINKTASCVYLKHLPTGIEIKCQQERSRELNRYYARKLLCDKLEQMLHRKKSAKQKEIDKIRKQKKKRSKRTQEKILEQKRQRSELKSLRKPPTSEE